MRANIKLTLQTGVVMVFVLAFMLTIMNSVTYAQDRREEPGTIGDNRDFESHQNALRMISERGTPARSEKKPKLTREQALIQAREDFMVIQVTNKSLRDAASANAALDFKFVSDSVTEIRVRAERLNTSLALPKLPKDAEPPKVTVAESPEELKASILNLSKLIRDFASNPCFKAASPLSDTQLATKAKLDLESIIALSKQLQKDSEKLEAAPEKKSP